MTGRNAILVIVFLDMLGAGLVMPMLPYLSQSFGAGPILIGLFGSMFPASQALASPFWGKAGDRYGRRPAILASVLGNLVAAALFVACAYEQSLWLLLVSRALAGAMSGSLVTTRAYLSDISEPNQLSKSMGLFGAAQALGFACGPAIGGFAAADGFLVPAWIAAVFTALSLVLSFLALPESKKKTETDTAIAAGAARSHLLPFYLKLFFVTFSLSHLFITFPMFIQEKFGYGPRENGFYFGALAVVAIVAQGFVFPRLARTWSETNLFSAGLAVTTASLFTFPFCESPGLALLLMGGVAFGFSLCSPAVTSLIQSKAGSGKQATVSGISETFAATARLLGPASAGLLMSAGGPRLAFAGAGLFGLAALLHLDRSRGVLQKS